MLEKLSTNCHWQKRTPDEALSCNLNSKDNFKFHIKRDIKYRTIYRISQELINETIESMNSRIADIIRNNGEKLKSIKVPFSTGTQARYCVQTILARFCDGSRQTLYDLRLVLDGLRRFLTILAINEINNELRVFLRPCYKTVVNRKESSLDNL